LPAVRSRALSCCCCCRPCCLLRTRYILVHGVYTSTICCYMPPKEEPCLSAREGVIMTRG
jgi:hypothetical protein